MPAFTRFYGVRPWELGDFTADELNEYVRYMNDWYREQAKANRKG